MMKTWKKICMMAVMAIVGTCSLASCSDDEDGGGSGSDFIEVVIDGKTYRENVYGVYALVPMQNDLVLCYSTEDVFGDKGFGLFYGMAIRESEEEILNSSTGTYRAVYDFRGNDVRNFDFTLDLEYYDRDEYYYVESGTHKVTSIRKVDGGVEIEGTFEVRLEENMTYEEKHVKGKYRMTTEAYGVKSKQDL